MRSVALIACLVALASAAAITPIALTADGVAWDAGTLVTDLDGTPDTYTYSLTGNDAGKNFYFRVQFVDCTGEQGSQAFKLSLHGDDGTGGLVTSGTFDVAGTQVSFQPNHDDPSSQTNTTSLISSVAEHSEKASGKSWTWTVALVSAISGRTCSYWAQLITYGSPISFSKVGKDGNPGPAQDAWVPCCNGVESSFQINMQKVEHHYLEVSATTVAGKWKSIKLTNPGNVFGISDVTSFPSATGKGTVTARTCLSNQSCTVEAANYYAHLTNIGYDDTDADRADSHATFTLTTKSGVASTSAAIAMVVAALFALFH
jgi:hypothetical protein